MAASPSSIAPVASETQSEHETAPMLAGERLACLRSHRLIFAELSFRVGRGEVLVLTGRNGSGKSSLIRMMAGLLPPFDGRLLRDGRPVQEDPGGHRADLAYVGHLDGIKLPLTVAANLSFWAAADHHGAAGAGVEKALATWGLAPLAQMPARYLSAGQRRRLALARLLVSCRRLWLLDEPTVALDAASVDTLGQLVQQHRADGGAAVVATHAALPISDCTELSLDGFAAPMEDTIG